uniref:Actin-binding Rho-activating protein n=1 Tax=Acanthochromis polyacanthus TaxID=80966 RepID=A0A3Q1GAS4_9TELE
MSSLKASANKNIKKLRAISAVCSLTSSWQKWVSDNETKQASEPSGWSPASLGGPEEKPKKTWVPKKPPPEAPKEAPTPRGATRAEEVKPEPLSLIKTKQVVKTVTSSVQEKSAGVGLLTEKIQKERPASGEEIDKLLKKKRSPTRRRKCSNMVSSLTKSWKTEVEKKLDMEDKQKANFNREEEEMSSEEDSAVRIKRPSAPLYKKEAEDANKINILSKKFSAVGNLKSRWQTWASEHSVGQKLNPFSEYFDYDYSMSLRLQKGQEGYGRPKEGTRTAERAKRAEQHIHREIDDMCYVIRTMADPDPDGKTRVTFGQLFDRYVRISDKVVGILMRARKHGKVAFEGEMLWQGQDDAVIITLLV